MGGTKKKPLAQAEKSQASQGAPKEAKKGEKKGKEEKGTMQQKLQSLTIPRLDDNQLAKAFGGMKAITTYRTSKALNINASVAVALLKNLESKNSIRRIGGYSGHYVWQLAIAG